jgi:hypothetical protein
MNPIVISDETLTAIRERVAAGAVSPGGRRMAFLDRINLLAEVDRLRATLGRVEQLAHDWDRDLEPAGETLRAVLSDDDHA